MMLVVERLNLNALLRHHVNINALHSTELGSELCKALIIEIAYCVSYVQSIQFQYAFELYRLLNDV
jgi:hypothetical protein